MKTKHLHAVIKAQQATIAELERQLEEVGGRVTERPVTFDNLEICWSKRTVTKGGRTITAPEGPDYFVMPIVGSRYIIEDTQP